jgi:hypothetical protein
VLPAQDAILYVDGVLTPEPANDLASGVPLIGSDHVNRPGAIEVVRP